MKLTDYDGDDKLKLTKEQYETIFSNSHEPFLSDYFCYKEAKNIINNKKIVHKLLQYYNKSVSSGDIKLQTIYNEIVHTAIGKDIKEIQSQPTVEDKLK